MTDETRKALTEYIGECWHEKGNKSRFNPVRESESWECKYCGRWGCANRTFTTPDDMAAVRKAIIERGEWEPFIRWCIDTQFGGGNTYQHEADFTQWLTDAETFCRVAGEWVGRKA